MTWYWLDAATITLSSFAAAALATSALVGLAGPVLARRAARYRTGRARHAAVPAARAAGRSAPRPAALGIALADLPVVRAARQQRGNRSRAR